MLERGAFDGRPRRDDGPPRRRRDGGDARARPSRQFEVSYHGKAAHAGAYPELGVNAADAMTVAQVAIGLLRQQLGRR